MLTLLARALALVPADDAAAMAEEVGIEYGRSLAAHMAPGEGRRSLQSALHDVAAALTAHGFAAHAEKRGGALQIISEHEETGQPMFTTQLLSQIIRFYGDSMQGFMGSYLEKSLQIFLDQQTKFRSQLNNILGQTPWSRPVRELLDGREAKQTTARLLGIDRIPDNATVLLGGCQVGNTIAICAEIRVPK